MSHQYLFNFKYQDSKRDMFSRFFTCSFNRSEAIEISSTHSFVFLSESLMSFSFNVSVAPMIVEIGVCSSCERELKSVLYNFIAFSFSSLCRDSFSISRILYVNTPLTIAITKYIKNIKISSVLPIVKVNFGGIKKKFQINALKNAARSTGKISKNIATNETVTSKINATTLYPMN